MWTEVDANLRPDARGGHSWVAVNETEVEAYRGVWLKFSPQLRTSGGVPGFSELRRLMFEADLLPRPESTYTPARFCSRAAFSAASSRCCASSAIARCWRAINRAFPASLPGPAVMRSIASRRSVTDRS